MNIGMIGVGYVGLVSAAGFAHMGNNVLCLDVDKKKINKLKEAIIPIYEPGLTDLIKLNIKTKNICFTTDAKKAVENSSVLFIAVGTPASIDGSADLKYVIEVSNSIASYINEYKIIAIKSTVPVGTCHMVRDIIKAGLKQRKLDIDFDVISNPEFLKEGHAIEDFMKPDRIIIGFDDNRIKSIINKLYTPFMKNKLRIIYMDIVSAEMTKYASNAMLATRISFMNELSRLCDKTGADIKDIRLGIGADSRIGPHFIYAGIGFGGSCFPKDVRALIQVGKEHSQDMSILKAVLDTNATQKDYFINKIATYFGEDKLSRLSFAVWGLAFKADTDDIRESPAIDIISALLKKNVKIRAFDPIAIEETKKVLQNVTYCDNQYEVLENSDALLILTDWKMFREPDFDKMKVFMKKHIIFDGRNQYEPSYMQELGFVYFSIGRQ